MPRKTDTISLGVTALKRSAKLLPCQKEMMHWWYKHGLSITKISKMFRCNKRLVQFELFPERKQRNLDLRKERGGSTIYYKKEKHTKAIREHRDYKKKILTA